MDSVQREMIADNRWQVAFRHLLDTRRALEDARRDSDISRRSKAATMLERARHHLRVVEARVRDELQDDGGARAGQHPAQDLLDDVAFAVARLDQHNAVVRRSVVASLVAEIERIADAEITSVEPEEPLVVLQRRLGRALQRTVKHRADLTPAEEHRLQDLVGQLKGS